MILATPCWFENKLKEYELPANGFDLEPHLVFEICTVSVVTRDCIAMLKLGNKIAKHVPVDYRLSCLISFPFVQC